MASSIPSFLFGAGTKYKTQEELDRAREQVKALLEDTTQYSGWGGVLENLGEGIAARLEKGRIGEGQEFLTGQQGPFSQTLAEIAGGYGGGDYDGADPITGGGGADTTAGGVGTDKGATASYIRDGLVARGLPEHVAEGFVMNLRDESGLNPGVQERVANVHGTKGFGLAQWTGPRRAALERFARERGAPVSDPDVQMDFLVQEGKTTERGAFGSILNTSTPGEAGAAIVSNFLRPAKQHEIARRNKYLSGGGGSNAQAGGGAGDSFLQAKPTRRRMTPAMLEQEAGTEKRPIWDDNPLAGRRRMTPAMTGIPDAVQPAPPAAPSPLDGRRRMTPAMINPAAAPAPAPLPAPDPARFGPTPPVPVAAPLQAAPQGAAPTGDRPRPTPPPPIPAAMFNPAPMGPPQRMMPGMAMAGTETAPYPQPAPAPAPRPVPPPPPAPAVAKVDPFTDMILGDKAAQFKPGNYIPPAPVGQQVFPAAPPAPGTPAAAGFGVPQQAMAGGGGSNTQAGGGGGQFPPTPAAPEQQRGGSPQNVIGKLMTILASPYASDEQKRMATAMLSREYDLEDERRKAASPEAQLDLEVKRAQLDDLKKNKTARPLTAEERKFWGIPDSDTRPYMLTEKGPEPVGGAGAASHTVTPMTAEDRQRFGIPDSDKRPYMLYDGKPELVGGAQAAGGGGVAKKSLTPVLMQRPDGSRYLAQPDEEGKILPSQVNEGDTPVDPTDKAYSTAYGRELGEVEGQRMAAAEQQIASAFDAKNILQQIRDNPYLERGTGASAWGNAIPGTGGYDFQNLVNQAKSGAFLTAIPQLKGFGALSNTEGAAATAAINRMDTATSKEAFIRALDDYESVIQTGLARAQDMIRKGTLPPPTLRGGEAPPPADGGGEWTTLPNGVKIRKK